MAKMTDRELIRLAMLDAMAWRYSLADAHGADTVMGKQAAFQAGQYREYHERKYGRVEKQAVKERIVNIRALRGPEPGIDLE